MMLVAPLRAMRREITPNARLSGMIVETFFSAAI